jgi:hypothetical protein
MVKLIYWTKGNQIQQISAFRGFKRKQLSEATGIPVSTLSSYQKEKTCFISGHRASIISNVLKWPIERLFPEKEESHVSTVNGV